MLKPGVFKSVPDVRYGEEFFCSLLAFGIQIPDFLEKSGIYSFTHTTSFSSTFMLEIPKGTKAGARKSRNSSIAFKLPHNNN
jgi:hypothetical protein